MKFVFLTRVIGLRRRGAAWYENRFLPGPALGLAGKAVSAEGAG